MVLQASARIRLICARVEEKKRRGWDLNPKAREGTGFLACGKAGKAEIPFGGR